VAYFRATADSVGDPAAVAQRGRDAGAALGADVPGAVAAIADRVLARVGTVEADALVGTPAGGMRLGDYLPTRTFELTVHTCDLAVALDQPLDVPEAAAVESLDVLGTLAARNARAGALLLAATGRRGLPPGFTVL
jgi:Mycothiol maleylpyruvate isomerase N-terminal domain